MNLKQQLIDSFKAHIHCVPDYLTRAPGRVNLIGEHTDYNDGFVLPMAIDRAVWIALHARLDRQVVVYSLDYNETAEFSLDDIHRSQGWSEYIKGVAWALQGAGYRLHGWEGVMAGDVPIGAGLSSSAATELAAAHAFTTVSGFKWDATLMAKICQLAENQWVGVNSGIMDQMVSAAARAGHALFLDCRSLEFQHVPVPVNVAVIVLDTTTRRGLVDSAYNERRAQCEAAARFYDIPALRDVAPEMLAEKAAGLDEVSFRRARHVVTENQRVMKTVDAMRAGDVVTLGELLSASHASLRDDFEVTNDALEQMVNCALRHPGCYGARMTGAGFGGSAVALVRRDAIEAFIESVKSCYYKATGLDSNVFVCQASEGASVTTLKDNSCCIAR